MQMNLETVMLSERNQTQKATYCMVLFIWNVQNRHIIETRWDQWWSGAGGGEVTE
jgi:hypothetical protein